MFNLRNWPWLKRWFGNRSERAAADFVKGLGYRILVRNFRCTLGEIDLIAADGATVVFVEVRSTQHAEHDRTTASVDRVKQKKLTKLALFFLKKNQLLNSPARFDVISVSWPIDSTKPSITHFLNAFEATDHFQMFS